MTEPHDDSSAQSAGAQDGKVIQDLESQVAKLTEIAARAQADLQNHKSRSKKESDDMRAYAVTPFLLALLPIRDDLSRASDYAQDDGYARILGKLDAMLLQHGLKIIDTEQLQADPSRHEILSTTPGTKDMITQVHEAGYELNGRVIRPAKVSVGDGTAAK